MNAEVDEADRMDDEAVIANMSSIVLGGQETTSGALSRLLCLMVHNKDLQQRLRTELNDARAKKGGVELDYNELNALPLLDAVVREALRLFAPVTFVWRATTEDCVVPLQFPIRDPRTGAEQRQLLIAKGTSVYVGLGAANRSKAVWGADAEELKPERWLGKNIADGTENSVKMPGIYSNVMTFLGGGRGCPGMKFALLEISESLASWGCL
jgi:cytochrome P450